MRTVRLREDEEFIGSHSGSDKMFLINNDILLLPSQLGSSG